MAALVSTVFLSEHESVKMTNGSCQSLVQISNQIFNVLKAD